MVPFTYASLTRSAPYRLRKFSAPERKKRVLLIIGCLLLIAALPIYGAAHGTVDWKNVYQFYFSFHEWLM